MPKKEALYTGNSPDGKGKAAAAALAAVLFCLLSAETVFAGQWFRAPGSGRWQYMNEKHVFYTDGIREIDGCLYCFDENGYLRTGWVQDGGDWYVYDPETGARLAGWYRDTGSVSVTGDTAAANVSNSGNGSAADVSGPWYYLDPDEGGRLKYGWHAEGADWYYLDTATGALKTGVFRAAAPDKTWNIYCTGENGAVIRNRDLVLSDGTELRFADDGVIYFRQSRSGWKNMRLYTGGTGWEVEVTGTV